MAAKQQQQQQQQQKQQQKHDREFEKNNSYRDKYYKTLSWLIFMGLTAGALSVALAYITMEQKEPDYYATTTAGSNIPLRPMSDPIVTNDYLVKWTSLAVRKAFNLDFVHSAEQLEQAKGYFTPAGWDKFMAALNKSGLLKTVKEKKVMSSAVVSDTPVILNRAMLNGRFTWRVQLPLLVSYTSASDVQKSKFLVTLNVQRVSALDTPEGIQISDFDSTLGTKDPNQGNV